MSDKTSQKTEDDMLEQTFGGYDEEMTVNTETQTSDPVTKTKVEKKKSSNALIYGLGGIAAVGIVGYTLLGSKPHPQPQPVATTAVAPVAASPVADAVAPVAPVADTNQPNQTAAAQFLSAQNPTSAGSTVVAPASDTSGAIASSQVAVPVNAAPVINTPTVVSTPAVVNTAPVDTQPVAPVTTAATAVNSTGNDVPVALVNQLKQMFADQTHELGGRLDDVGNRVSALEKTVADQKDVNKSLDERLARLESGKTTKTVVAKSEKTDATAPQATEHKVKHVARRHVVRKAHHAVADDASDVLVDKTESVSSTPAASALAPVEVHSVYAGRVWTRNSDGSLSTYSSGDRLPTGEIVRRVEDNKIVTDKRVISVK